MKKILFLGGSTQQIPALEYANQQGYYSILCDYLPDNPGQEFAKKFYCISTTDKESVLKVAQKEKIDGIVAYASDPAAVTAAYVAEKMDLPTNPLKSVEILAYKNEFRNFLEKNQFNCPKARSFSKLIDAKKELKIFTFPVMVKPVDSSGSKGVSKVASLEDFDNAFTVALQNSKIKKVIVEEYIERNHEFMIGGDCFVKDGKVVYWGLLNCYRNNNVNELVPVGKSYPLFIDEDKIDKVKREVQKIMDILQIKFGGFNLEVMIDDQDRVFIIEMGPRNGGNLIPDFLNIIHKVNLIGATVETSINNYEKLSLEANTNFGYYATYNIHSEKTGSLLDVKFKNNVGSKFIKHVMYKNIGDIVQRFNGANNAIGIAFIEFPSKNEQLRFISTPEEWIEVIVE